MFRNAKAFKCRKERVRIKNMVFNVLVIGRGHPRLLMLVECVRFADVPNYKSVSVILPRFKKWLV